MTADNIRTCVLDMGEVINVAFRSALLKLVAQAFSWWLNLMCANKGFGSVVFIFCIFFALFDVALYQQDER